MTPEQFCYWFQGRAELQPDTPPTKAEWKIIREHLATVFVKITPAHPNSIPTYFPNTTGVPSIQLPYITTC